MKYADFLKKDSFSHQELLGFAYRTLICDPPESMMLTLPTPPMLMIDKVLSISKDSNAMSLIAEKKVHLDDWFFQCHFRYDPVQPGCLGVDAIWQLLGFYCACSGAVGTGRALGCKEIDFFGQIRPHNRIVRYEITIRRQQMHPQLLTAVIIGSGKVFVDDQHIYTVKDAKVGTFLKINYANYPFLNDNAIGGAIS